MTATSPSDKSKFFRPFLQLSQEIGWLGGIKAGGSFERESNRNSETNSDLLSNKSFYYDYLKAFLSSTEKSRFQWRLSLNQRLDKAPVNDLFEKSSTANELQFNGQWINGSKGNIQWDFSLRNLKINNEDLTDQKPKTSYLGKIDFNYSWFEGGIRTTSSYLLNNGQEAKLEFNFQEVQEGRGDFIWLDENMDGIQNLNEFLPAPFADEANFIRVRVFNNEFINTNNIIWSQSLRIEPKKFLKKSSRSLLTKFSWVGNFRINQKTEETGDNRFSPFRFDIQDTSIVSYASSFNQTLFYNRGNPSYDLQFNYRNTQNKFVQITGFELSTQSELGLRSRVNIQQKIDILLNVLWTQRKKDSQLFDQNDYLIESLEFKS